ICCHPFEDDSLNYPVVTVSKGGSTIQRQGQYARFVNFAGNREPSNDEVEMGRSSYASRYKGGMTHG
ncbi:hypothetical protein, partial [Pseudomonas defluvii]|uniref:hypothetical protein n=1 Tax=Pseudomonas defluvii TaxID=1876757 RepID=UPI001147050A